MPDFPFAALIEELPDERKPDEFTFDEYLEQARKAKVVGDTTARRTLNKACEEGRVERRSAILDGKAGYLYRMVE